MHKHVIIVRWTIAMQNGLQYKCNVCIVRKNLETTKTKISIACYRKYVVYLLLAIKITTEWMKQKNVIFYIYIDVLSAIITGNTTQSSNPGTIRALISFIMYVWYTPFFTKYFDDIFALRVFISTFAAWTDTLKSEFERWCGCSQSKDYKLLQNTL